MHHHCHCSICRKAHGSPFVTFVGVEASDFRWLTGDEALVRYRATPDSVYERTFCPRCGSAGPIPVAGRVYMPAGVFGRRPRSAAGTSHLHRLTAQSAVASDHRWSGAVRELRRRLAAAAGGRTTGAARRPGGRHRRQLSLRGGRVSHHRAFPEDPQLLLPSLSEGSLGGPRDQRHRARAGSPSSRARTISCRTRCPTPRSSSRCSAAPAARSCPRSTRARSVLRIARRAGHPSGRGPDDNIFVAYRAPWYEITDGLVCYDEAPPGGYT